MNILIDKFLHYCISKEIFFSKSKISIYQIIACWKKIFIEIISEKEAKKIYSIILKKHKEIFLGDYSTLKMKFPIFCIYCEQKKIKFFMNSIQGEEKFVEVWYECFNEEIQITQAHYYMSKFEGINIPKFNSIKKVDIWEKKDNVQNDEYDKVAHYCVLNNIYIERNRIPSMRLVSYIWYQLFNKYVQAYNITYVEKETSPHEYFNGQINMLVLKNKLIQKEKELTEKYNKVFTYCQKNYLDLTNDYENLTKIKNIWTHLFYEKLSTEEAKLHISNLINKRILHSLILREDFILFYEYCNINTIVFKNSSNITSKIREIWMEILGKNITLKQSKITLKKLIYDYPNIFRIVQRSIICKEIENYCNTNFISLKNEILGINQIKVIFEEIFFYKIDNDTASNYLNYLRVHFPNLFIYSTKHFEIPDFENLMSIKEEQKKELLIIFAEYCKNNAIYFNVTKDSEEKIKLIWSKCFGI